MSADDAPVTLAQLAAMACRAGAPRLADASIGGWLRVLRDWSTDAGALTKTFRFRSYPETMAFANAVAWFAQRQDHHPDLHVGFDRCRVVWSTHAAGGITQNDCIAAARTEQLVT